MFVVDGIQQEKDYTIFCQNRLPKEPCFHAIGFAVRNSLLSMLVLSTVDSKSIIFHRF